MTLNKLWDDDMSRKYQTLINGMSNTEMRSQILQLAHFFMLDQFEFTSVITQNVVMQFRYPFSLLKDLSISSQYLQMLQEYIKAPGKSIQMVVSIDVFKPKQTFIRIDPQGDTITQLQ